DGLRLRWTFWRRGFGMFPDATRIKSQTDVYTLKTFTGSERAGKELGRLQTVEDQSVELKTKMMEKIRDERSYRNDTATGISKIDSSAFGVPTKWWAKSFKQMFPVSKDQSSDNHLPEVLFPTFRVVQVDDTSLLTRTRMGPNKIDIDDTAPPP